MRQNVSPHACQGGGDSRPRRKYFGQTLAELPSALNGSKGAAILQRPYCPFRFILAQDQFDFVAYSISCSAFEIMGIPARSEIHGIRFDFKPETTRKAHRSEDSSRVVDEAVIMQHADQSTLEIGSAAVRVNDAT